MEFFLKFLFCFFQTNLSVPVPNISVFKHGHLPLGSNELKKRRKMWELFFSFYLLNNGNCKAIGKVRGKSVMGKVRGVCGNRADRILVIEKVTLPLTGSGGFLFCLKEEEMKLLIIF